MKISNRYKFEETITHRIRHVEEDILWTAQIKIKPTNDLLNL